MTDLSNFETEAANAWQRLKAWWKGFTPAGKLLVGATVGVLALLIAAAVL